MYMKDHLNEKKGAEMKIGGIGSCFYGSMGSKSLYIDDVNEKSKDVTTLTTEHST